MNDPFGDFKTNRELRNEVNNAILRAVDDAWDSSEIRTARRCEGIARNSGNLITANEIRLAFPSAFTDNYVPDLKTGGCNQHAGWMLGCQACFLLLCDQRTACHDRAV
jgi:hypothetical protein